MRWPRAVVHLGEPRSRPPMLIAALKSAHHPALVDPLATDVVLSTRCAHDVRWPRRGSGSCRDDMESF